jgi:hypothetical protein
LLPCFLTEIEDCPGEVARSIENRTDDDCDKYGCGRLGRESQA